MNPGIEWPIWSFSQLMLLYEEESYGYKFHAGAVRRTSHHIESSECRIQR